MQCILCLAGYTIGAAENSGDNFNILENFTLGRLHTRACQQLPAGIAYSRHCILQALHTVHALAGHTIEAAELTAVGSALNQLAPPMIAIPMQEQMHPPADL